MKKIVFMEYLKDRTALHQHKVFVCLLLKQKVEE